MPRFTKSAKSAQELAAKGAILSCRQNGIHIEPCAPCVDDLHREGGGVVDSDLSEFDGAWAEGKLGLKLVDGLVLAASGEKYGEKQNSIHASGLRLKGIRGPPCLLGNPLKNPAAAVA